MKQRILIVDDHPITRAGIRAILESKETLEIIGEAKDGQEAIDQASALQPDIVVMDISMPQLSGIDATREILKEYPQTKVVALSIHSGVRYVQEMLDAGVQGYLLKDEAPEELIKAIMNIAEGRMFLSPMVVRGAIDRKNQSGVRKKINILTSKIQRPPVLHDFVIRKKVIKELEDNQRKPLSLVSASAGYGKSVAISEWLNQSDSLSAWISLDQEHNDLRTFLSYLVAAVERIIPGILNQTAKLVSNPVLPPLKDISNTLINELCDIDMGLILVLDDYHLINNQNVHEILSDWIRFPPPSIHLCIITRRDPPLNIQSLRLNDRVTEIRMDKLMFSQDEITELFKQTSNYELDQESLNFLEETTEGWIISLKLISMIKKDPDKLKEALKSIRGGLHAISEFLLHEVFNDQPDYLQELLLESSILNRFCEDLLEFISKESDIKKTYHDVGFINSLTRMNLFVIPLDIESTWYRYHHMFRDFLKDQLKSKKTSAERSRIYLRASQWFERNNLIQEAVEYASKSGKMDEAVRIINENWEKVSNADDFLEVNRWLSFIPKKIKDADIGLLLARFYCVFKGHKLGELPEVLGLVLDSKQKLSRAEEGHLALINSMLSYYSADGKAAVEKSLEALDKIPEQYYSFRGDVRSYWMISMYMIGKHDELLKSHRTSIAQFLKEGENVQLGRARHNLGFFALFSANLPMLRSTTNEMAKTPELTNFMLGFYYSNLQYIKWFNHEWWEIIIECDKVISVKYEYTGRLVLDAHIIKALVLSRFNQNDLAYQIMDEALQFAENSGDPYDKLVARSGKARLNLNQNRLEKAVEWLNQTAYSPIEAGMLWAVEVPVVTRCRIMIERGGEKDLEEAIKLLLEYQQFADSIHSRIQSIDITVLLAIAYYRAARESEALEALGVAIVMAAPGEWIGPFAENYYSISPLLEKLKDQNVEPYFIEMIFSSVAKLEVKREELGFDKGKTKKKLEKEDLAVLTPSEVKVLHLVAEGFRNKEIADRLHNSEETIKKHLSNMFQKLYVKNRLSLVVRAKELGILVD